MCEIKGSGSFECLGTYLGDHGPSRSQHPHGNSLPLPS